MTSLEQPVHFHILLNLYFSVLEINKYDVERYKEYVHSVVVFEQYLTRLGEILLTSLDIFDIRQRILYINNG